MKTVRTQVRRIPKRASYDRAQVYAILDAARICHLGFVVDQQPYVIPTIHTRIGDTLYIHGAPASRMLKVLAQGVPICVTVSHVDGLVLAKSAFHHSMNYRSVMVLGKAALVEDLEQKAAALRGFVEDIAPGRYSDCRPPNRKELKSTSVLRVPIEEASAKVRTGGPVDDAEDLGLGYWSGVLPLRPQFDDAIASSDGIAMPDYLQSLAPNNE